jgi:hypothetical protein
MLEDELVTLPRDEPEERRECGALQPGSAGPDDCRQLGVLRLPLHHAPH